MAGISIPRPPRPENDLRTQLLDRILRTALSGLAAGDARRAAVGRSGDWESHAMHVRRAVQNAFGPMPAGATGGPLNDRVVSTHDTRHCRIENVLFESFPGWEVNASLFIPKGSGPHPAVILPVGHSGKQFESYQIPAQAFASLGFIAVLFDPPGQASEKQRGNDHFRDGVRAFLLGLSPNRYFVLDALRCIDYLETRDDAAVDRGVAMSGVSGGGITTLYATLLDERVACFGPSCCLNAFADHPIGDVYSACPEQFWLRRLAQGIDNVDVALASAPRPMLYMAGRDDEVFQIEPTRRLAATIAEGYAAGGAGQRFDFFEDESGHAYTLAQTARFAQWARRWLLEESDPALPTLERGDFELLDYELLKCSPSDDTTMFSITRDLGRGLAEARSAAAKRPRDEVKNAAELPDGRPVDTAAGVGAAGAAAAARDVTTGGGRLPNARRIGFSAGPVTGAQSVLGTPSELESWQEGNRTRLWSQGVSEGLCTIEGLSVPMTILKPWRPVSASAVVLWIDEAGRAAALESGGPAFRIARVVERDRQMSFPEVYAPDLPGFGDSRPMVTPYQAAPWGSMDRTLSYFSFGTGDPVLAISVRAAATLIDELAVRTSLPDASVIVAGRGLGGVIALLAAALSDTRCSVCTVDSLASFQHLLEEEFYDWPAATFLPDALNHFDLPELAEVLHAAGRKLLIINPRDGRRAELAGGGAKRLFGEVPAPAGLSGGEIDAAILALIDDCAVG